MSEACARCGRVATGLASIGDERLCHGDGSSPSCYEAAQYERNEHRRSELTALESS